jgi:hypothetical protein
MLKKQLQSDEQIAGDETYNRIVHVRFASVQKRIGVQLRADHPHNSRHCVQKSKHVSECSKGQIVRTTRATAYKKASTYRSAAKGRSSAQLAPLLTNERGRTVHIRSLFKKNGGCGANMTEFALVSLSTDNGGGWCK